MSSILYQEQNIPYRNESIQQPPRGGTQKTT